MEGFFDVDGVYDSVDVGFEYFLFILVNFVYLWFDWILDENLFLIFLDSSFGIVISFLVDLIEFFEEFCEELKYYIGISLIKGCFLVDKLEGNVL